MCVQILIVCPGQERGHQQRLAAVPGGDLFVGGGDHQVCLREIKVILHVYRQQCGQVDVALVFAEQPLL